MAPALPRPIAIPPLLGICALVSLWSFPSAANQKQFYQTTTTTNDKGSDDSLENSAVYAMSALMDLSALNYRSALNNGINAYGKYRNSETMDRLSRENTILALSMGTLGSTNGSGNSGPVKPGDGSGASGVSGNPQTSFRRLDPKFLREGKAAQVAAEFEKRSGMSREKFLEQLSSISEQKLSRHDPQLVEKAIGRFENFVKQIPNAEFRGGLQKAVNAVPSTVRSGVIAKAVARFASLTAGSVAAVGVDSSEGVEAQGIPQVLASPSVSSGRGSESSIDVAQSPNGLEKRELASTLTAGLGGSALSIAPKESDGTTEGKNAIGSVVKAALDTQGQELTLFQIVNRKYRILTPQLR